jgi:[ribosomal protein S5]-alanine N-acetyltransferase
MSRIRAVSFGWTDVKPFAPIELARATLRELQANDAASLVPLLRDPAVRRFLPQAPHTADAFRRHVAWMRQERRRGRYLSVAVVVNNRAVGFFHVWPLDPAAQTVEWGFAFGRRYWGQGLFQETAAAFVSFAIRQLRVERLEARTAVSNLRATAALLRLGAHPEGVLRHSATVDDRRSDALMWAILASERVAAPRPGSRDTRVVT